MKFLNCGMKKATWVKAIYHQNNGYITHMNGHKLKLETSKINKILKLKIEKNVLLGQT